LKFPAAVTASLGAATLPTNAATEDELVKAADEALYESKRSGRDRVARSRRIGKRQVPEENVEQQLTL
jgi:PleD family two-component response regulator